MSKNPPTLSPTEHEKALLVAAGFPRTEPYYALRPGQYPSYQDFLAQQGLDVQRAAWPCAFRLTVQDLESHYGGEYPLVDVLNQRVLPFSRWAQDLIDVLEKGMPHG